jgi:protein-disulfide isomerase
VPLRIALERHKDRVRLVYRHYPIVSLHPDAAVAAEAAECAGEQGQFWAMYDKLYLNQAALGFADLVRYSGEIGLDSGAFETCLSGGRYRERVERDRQAAEALGLSGTPTFFFNGQPVAGAIPADVLDEIIGTYLK